MLKAHLRFEGIKDGFDDEALAQHDLVSQGHQVVAHVPADTGNEVQAALPECLEQVLTDIAFIGVELAGQVSGDLIQHGAVGGVAGGDFHGHDLALVDLLRKSGEFPMSYEELDDTAATVYEGI